MRKKYLLLPAMLVCSLSFLLYACGGTDQPKPTPQPTTYTVTFNYNYDGAPDAGIYKTETVDENTAVAKPAERKCTYHRDYKKAKKFKNLRFL